MLRKIKDYIMNFFKEVDFSERGYDEHEDPYVQHLINNQSEKKTNGNLE